MRRDEVEKKEGQFIYIYIYMKGTGTSTYTSEREHVSGKRVRNPSEMARQIPPRAKNPFCIKISCPRIADRPPDPFSAPPNSTGPDQLGRSSTEFSQGLRTSIQPSRIGRQGSWDVRDASSVDRAQSGHSDGLKYRRI